MSREKLKTYTVKQESKRVNNEAQRFSRYKPAKSGNALKYVTLDDPDKHLEVWKNRWEVPVSPSEGFAQVTEKCNFKQGSARSLNKPITVLEIALAVRDTNPWKAPGPDGVYHSLIKRYLDVIMPILLREYNKIWESEDTPGEWFTTGKTILFSKHKGGDKSGPKNFRPIIMVNTMYKILSSIIDKRMLTSMMKTGNWDRDQQAMGKTRRGCLDAHMIS